MEVSKEGMNEKNPLFMYSRVASTLNVNENMTTAQKNRVRENLYKQLSNSAQRKNPLVLRTRKYSGTQMSQQSSGHH